MAKGFKIKVILIGKQCDSRSIMPFIDAPCGLLRGDMSTAPSQTGSTLGALIPKNLPRDDRILLLTRIVAVVIIALLLLAFVLL